jgi:phospholipid transport system transporter-binding protein
MIRRDGDRLVVSGALTLGSVTAELEAGKAAIGEGARSVDLAEVAEVDSSALALLLAWQREAKRLDRELAIANLPKGLATIASLYGVADLLGAAPASNHH